jgi:hypothetical protein
MTQSDEEHAELSVSDNSQLASLADFMRLTTPNVRVTRLAGHAGPFEQGALDTLMIVAESSVLVAAVKVLPEFVRSRKTGFSISPRYLLRATAGTGLRTC